MFYLLKGNIRCRVRVFRVQGLGFRVYRVHRFYGLGLGFIAFIGFTIQGLGFGCWVKGLGFRT